MSEAIRSSYLLAAAAEFAAGRDDDDAVTVRDMPGRVELVVAALFSFVAADDGGLPPPPTGGRVDALLTAPAVVPAVLAAPPRIPPPALPAAARPAVVGALPPLPFPHFTVLPPFPFALAALGSYPSRLSALSSPDVWSWKALSHWQNSRLSWYLPRMSLSTLCSRAKKSTVRPVERKHQEAFQSARKNSLDVALHLVLPERALEQFVIRDVLVRRLGCSTHVTQGLERQSRVERTIWIVIVIRAG